MYTLKGDLSNGKTKKRMKKTEVKKIFGKNEGENLKKQVLR